MYQVFSFLVWSEEGQNGYDKSVGWRKEANMSLRSEQLGQGRLIPNRTLLLLLLNHSIRAL